MRVQVFSGDIAKVETEALITAINSGGMWFGGIDGVIQRQAGDMFHAQAASAMPLKDGQTVVARTNGHHRGAFANVIFVVDDLKQKLRQVVLAGLTAAADAKFMAVSLPTIRMGVMLGAVEKSKREAVNELVEGIKLFQKANPNSSVKSLTFVVYNDPEIMELAQIALLPLSSID